MRAIHRSPVTRCGALTFSFICAWVNGWVNNGHVGDLRRHRAHYDITVMDRRQTEVDLFDCSLKNKLKWKMNQRCRQRRLQNVDCFVHMREDWVNAEYITVTSWWARWRLKSPASRLFTQAFIPAQIKENNKACCLTVPSHYLNQWLFLIVRYCDIHPRAISHWVPMRLLICIMSLKIVLLKLLPHLPGSNGLNYSSTDKLGGLFCQFNCSYSSRASFCN